MTKEQAEEMLRELSKHYGEPVMPVSRYCATFDAWIGAVGEGADRDGKDSGNAALYDTLTMARLAVHKSNLLWRLIYGGEQLRTEMCPEHKGRWSGCAWPDSACPHCMHGSNVTGWKRGPATP